MKMVVNRAFGGFRLPVEFAKHHQLDVYDDVDRTMPELVAFVEDYGGTYIDSYCKLTVVEIPDSCTDQKLLEYDGAEQVIYVVDGKIYYA